MTAEKFYLSTDYAKFTIRRPNYKLDWTILVATAPLTRGTHEEYIYLEYPKPISEDIAKILNKYAEKVLYTVDAGTQLYLGEEEIRYESR